MELATGLKGMPRLDPPFGNGGRDRQVKRRSGGAVAAVAEARDEPQETPTDPDGLLLESKMTQPEIAKTTRVSLSTVNPACTAYDLGGCAALDPKARGGRIRENMTLAEEKALLERLSGQQA